MINERRDEISGKEGYRLSLSTTATKERQSVLSEDYLVEAAKV